MSTAGVVASLGLAAASASTVTVSGTLDEGMPSNGPGLEGATPADPGYAFSNFSIVLDVDDDAVADSQGVFAAGTVNSALISVAAGGEGAAEYMFTKVVDIASDPSSQAMDELNFELVSSTGDAAGDLIGNFHISFMFMNDMLNDGTMSGALDALGSYVAAHLLFEFGGYGYYGMVDDVTVVTPANPIPLPGAAVFMLSGLAAAGATTARRRRNA
ncbi:hypothetical protein [Parvularcula dongshanensis]|nr:hypothetical protein [Parvularcula dongshanensis]